MEGASQYSDGEIDNGLSLRIVDAYALAPDQWHKKYRNYAVAGIRQALADYQELWIGAIVGEAREGRNYFDRWYQSPESLF